MVLTGLTGRVRPIPATTSEMVRFLDRGEAPVTIGRVAGIIRAMRTPF